MQRENDPKDGASTILEYEPTGLPEYEHDFYNMTNKEKARQLLDDMMFEFLDKGGAIKKLPTIKE